jgi:HK97 family phage major capsid protein
MPIAEVEFADQLKGKTAKQLAEMLSEKSRTAVEFLRSKETVVNGETTYDLTLAEVERVRQEQAELAEIGRALDAARAVDIERAVRESKAAYERATMQPINQPPFPGGDHAAWSQAGQQLRAKSLGQIFIESAEYKAQAARGDFAQANISVRADEFEFKTTMTTSAGFAPANDRTDIVVPFATRRPMLQDLIPTIPTTLDAIKYMEETTFTNNAAGTAEGAALPESAIAYTERSQPVENVGTSLPVTEQQLEVQDSIRAIIDQRLMLMYSLKEEADMLTGNGTSPNLLGFLNKPGIQTQAVGADPVPDALYKLLTKLRGGSNAGFVEPTAYVIHPNDWQDIRILKDQNGNYLWGPPSEPGPERIWGKPLVVTTAITENTVLAGDFALYSQIWRKRGARVEAGLVNDDFRKMQMTLRIYGRLALVILRASAFGVCTGA